MIVLGFQSQLIAPRLLNRAISDLNVHMLKTKRAAKELFTWLP